LAATGALALAFGLVAVLAFTGGLTCGLAFLPAGFGGAAFAAGAPFFTGAGRARRGLAPLVASLALPVGETLRLLRADGECRTPGGGIVVLRSLVADAFIAKPRGSNNANIQSR
jgi:hypothetical protein